MFLITLKNPDTLVRDIIIIKLVDKDFKYEQKEKSIIKDEEQFKNLKIAAQIAAEALRRGVESIKEGMSTDDVDEVIHNYIISQNAYPAAINYMGFPKSVCTSVNESISIFNK